MGLSFSIDHIQTEGTDGPKAAMLLKYDKESLQPVSFIDFILNPLAFSNNPLIMLEPFSNMAIPNTEPPVSGLSYQDTMRVFHNHFKIQTFKLSNQNVWFIISNKLSSTACKEAMNFIRKAPLNHYTCMKCVDPSQIFIDAEGISGLKRALKPPSATSGIRASSPIRTAGVINCAPSLMQRRSHNPGMLNTFKIPPIPSPTIREEIQPDDMNLIIPGVFVGGERAAANFKLLVDNRVTHIINLCGNTTAEHFPGKFEYFTIKMNDNEFEELPPEFWDALTFLKKTTQNGGVTLVHCRRGICRSAALVAAYLSDERQMTIDAAVAMIKKKRPVVNINPGFLDQLHNREEARNRSRAKPRLLLNLK